MKSLLATFFALGAAGCALVNHPIVVATTPPTTAASFDDLVKAHGPIEVESVVSARWAVPLSGLLDLEDPRAIEAGLEDREAPIVLPVHVLKHPAHGVFIVDSGITNDRVQGGRGGTRAAVEWYVRDIQPVEGLADIVARQKRPVAGVLLTHMHVDHVLGLPDLPLETPVYTGPAESAASSVMHVFLRSTYDAIFEGRGPIRELDFANAPRVGSIPGVIDLLGDGSLWALASPGHTPGSAAYLANTTEGPMLFVGDTSHTRWGWDHDVPPGTFTADRAKNAESLAALRALVAAHPEIRVFVGHELGDGPATVGSRGM